MSDVPEEIKRMPQFAWPVVSETTATQRTLTITTPEGHICTFKGQMEFTWVIAP